MFSVTKIKNDTGVTIKIPSDSENSNTIRIEGEKPGVGQAKKELLEMASRMVTTVKLSCISTRCMAFVTRRL